MFERRRSWRRRRLPPSPGRNGRLYLTQTRVRGRYVIRFAIGQLYTTRAHVARAWEVIAATARELPISS